MKHDNKKRVFQIIATVLLTAALTVMPLTGCSGQSDPQESSSPSGTTSDAGDAESDIGKSYTGEGVKLTLNQIGTKNFISSGTETAVTPKSGYTFIFAEFSLETLKEDTVEFWTLNDLVPSVDGYVISLGQYFTVFPSEVNGLKNLLTSNTVVVPAGSVTKGYLAFEVPSDFHTCEISFGGDRGNFGVFHFRNPDNLSESAPESSQSKSIASKESGSFRFSLLKTEAADASSFRLPEPAQGNHYVSVTMEIQNISEVTHDLNMNNFYILQNDNATYPALERSYLHYISPGKILLDTIIIEIPTNAQTCQLCYGETITAGNELFDIQTASATVQVSDTSES